MTPTQRQRLHDLMRLLLAHEPQVDYPVHDVRGPLDAATYALTGAQMRKRLADGKHLMTDCSQAIACLYRWAGLENPSGPIGWPGTTGTLLHRVQVDGKLAHYTDASLARTGAIVIFGPGTGEHGALVMEAGADPLLWSHGFNGGPVAIRLSKERGYHHAPVTLLNVSGIKAA